MPALFSNDSQCLKCSENTSIIYRALMIDGSYITSKSKECVRVILLCISSFLEEPGGGGRGDQWCSLKWSGCNYKRGGSSFVLVVCGRLQPMLAFLYISPSLSPLHALNASNWPFERARSNGNTMLIIIFGTRNSRSIVVFVSGYPFRLTCSSITPDIHRL